MDERLLADFLRGLRTDPNGRIRVRDLYAAFKMTPKTEGIWRTRFIRLLLESGADVRQNGKHLWLHGLVLTNPPDNRAHRPPGKTIRVDEPRLCLRCGKPCEGSYGGDGASWCEACRVTDWVHYGAHGARHRHTAMRTGVKSPAA